MGSPAIFAGKRSKLLSSKGLLYSNGSINDYNGDINYILNGHAEVNTTGWATYADAAQSTPVDGTGGSPSVTWTQTTTSPLDDLGSFVFTKDAVNRQGQGASYAFTIDSASQAKVMTITFDYIVGSGTFVAGSSSVDSDLEVFIYDVTNSVLIQPSTYKLYSNSSTVASQFIANFQTPYNSTSYRLIFHCATTSASAYTVKFDNVKVSPTQYTYGTPITDWSAYTPTFTGLGTVTNISFYWRRVGGNLETTGKFISGTPTAVEVRISLPNNFTSVSTIPTIAICGALGQDVAGAYGIYTLIEPSVSYMTLSNNAGAAALTKALGTGSWASGRVGYLNSSIPITGWSSCVQMSDSTTQQVVAASYWCSANFAASTTVPINFDSKDFDTTGSVTTSATAWKFIAPVAGVYQVSMFTNIVGSTTVNFVIYKNGSAYKSLFYSIGGAASGGCQELQLNGGDYIDIRPSTSASVVGGTLTAAGTAIITIQRISGPASIAANDTVAAFYYASANTTGTSSAPFNFDTKVFDYTGSVTTGAAWKFTAPVAGLYSMVVYTNGAISADYIRLYKNGVFNNTLGYGPTNAISTLPCSIKLNAGDYIDFRAATSLTANGGTLAANTTSWCTITKTGTF